jgi:superfamily I DNA/RNA helicase
MESSLDYVWILRALAELPFRVGKNLLVDVLNGNLKNKSVVKNRLDELESFGELNWEKDRIFREVDRLVLNGMIEFVESDYNKFVKVLSLTEKGRTEVENPSLDGKRLGKKFDFGKTEISEEDRIKFKELDSFLGRFNDEQKKAIISDRANVLCVAGAGSGKTTVLTKRIEFLVKYRGVVPRDILAITFTRKARQEMERRLDDLNVNGVAVHTFNSFCEGILRKHEARIYGRPIRIQGYPDKILAMNMALASMGLSMDDVLDWYFSPGQKKFMTGNQMANSFMNDCFSVMDYFKVSERKFDFSEGVDEKHKRSAERIRDITKYLGEHMEVQGLRDYSDQMIDAVKFLKESPVDVPKFKHVLVDEYQDVNAMQIELLDLLRPSAARGIPSKEGTDVPSSSGNLFVVGDPRQSIFGWRGSDINYILDFGKSYEDVEVVHLTKNYRSGREIVEFMNSSISEMGLPDLSVARGIPSELGTSKEAPSLSDSIINDVETKIRILDFENESAEREFVLGEIVDGDVPNGEIFVLARTNRQLMELSQLMKKRGIKHVVKTDEVRKPVEGGEGDVTLATVHAIKGLEAKKVFVIGVNESNFPCKASDHPAIEMVKRDEYDREEEERRLFYVAISRAKKILYVTYSGKKPSYFINDEMVRMISGDERVDVEEEVGDGVAGELKSWRRAVSEEKGVPAYVVLSNAVIDEIARVKPVDADELARVKGIGPAKLIEYGAKILEIVGESGD